MRTRNNWKLWGIVFLAFLLIFVAQALNITSHKKAFPPMADIPLGGPAWIPPPTPAKEAIDYWGFIVKGGVVLSGLKTLLDLIDKFRIKRKA
jgi:hypothetical protein